jgi:hypothetical protein
MVTRSRWRSYGVGRWSMFAVLTAVAVSLAFVAAGTARASGGPPPIAAGPAFGFVPSHNASHGSHGRATPLLYHGGPVQSAPTQVGAIYWGTSWGNSTFKGDKVSGLDTLYSNVGGTGYAHTNSEYTDGSGNHVNTTSITQLADVTDLSATPSGAPTTAQVLAEVAKATGNKPVANAYYPVYSDRPRGTAGYCAWHSAGTINGTPVQFGFFFNLDGDPGCDPGDPSTTHSQGLEALANVTGHELSEMLTDPKLNAWYDQQGNENADKCAWTFSGYVSIGGQNWKIQGNWSNAASGCIETS